MQCPKCGHQQQEEVSCASCGIYFEKYRAAQARAAAGVSAAPALASAPYAEFSREAPVGSDVTPQDRRTIAIFLFFIAAIVVMVSLHYHHVAMRCSALAPAVLDNQYRVVTTSKFGIPIHTRYEVNYTFTAKGQSFKGHDALSKEPTGLEVTAHYDPADPTDSILEPHPLSPGWMLLTVLLVGGGFAALKLGRAKPAAR